MAFSFRHIISNIPYFKKSGDDSSPGSENLSSSSSKKRRHISLNDTGNSSKSSCSDKIEDVDQKISDVKPQETTEQVAILDTEVFTMDITSTKQGKKKAKKLKLDMATISGSTEVINQESLYNCAIENTPQQINLQNRRSEMFSERLKEFDLSRSFDIYDLMNDKETDTNYDVQSLSEHSESDISLASHDDVKMCRKVQLLSELSDSSDGEQNLVHSSSIESFVDVGLDKNEEDRISLLLSFQVKFEKLERLLQQLLNEFQFHIEVSKVFQTKSIVTALPGSDITNLPKKYGEITYIDETSRGPSPSGTWNIVIENEDDISKFKLRKQLLSMKRCIENFVKEYLHNTELMLAKKAITSNLKMTQILDSNKKGREKRLRINKKKRERCMNDFPDLEEVLQKLFSLDTNIHSDTSNLEVDTSGDTDEKCTCKCRYHRECSSLSHTDSGVKTCEDKLNQSITSSIGNFSLDSNSLSAYSESLDNIISYSSFNDSSIYNSILQKPAIERITFYVTVHGIQLKSDDNDMTYDLKPRVIFSCHSCFTDLYNEQDLIKHILTQKHCEKIHFLYKNAYIKKCIASDQEIMPSTVLNPMKMYRDDNKIVCFGDGIFACTLCFENMIVGESVLMAHCDTEDHQERRDQLNDLLENLG